MRRRRATVAKAPEPSSGSDEGTSNISTAEPPAESTASTEPVAADSEGKPQETADEPTVPSEAESTENAEPAMIQIWRPRRRNDGAGRGRRGRGARSADGPPGRGGRSGATDDGPRRRQGHRAADARPGDQKGAGDKPRGDRASPSMVASGMLVSRNPGGGATTRENLFEPARPGRAASEPQTPIRRSRH